jgi:hypothetical protein
MSESATKQPKSNKDMWLWPLVLSKLLESLVLSTPIAAQLWEMIEIWLENGATPPLEIFLEMFSCEDDKRICLRVDESSDVESIGSSMIEYRGQEIGSSRTEYTGQEIGVICFRLPILEDPASSSPSNIWHMRTNFEVRMDNIDKLVPRLQTYRSITFTELVHYHNPLNAETLLRYVG